MHLSSACLHWYGLRFVPNILCRFHHDRSLHTFKFCLLSGSILGGSNDVRPGATGACFWSEYAAGGNAAQRCSSHAPHCVHMRPGSAPTQSAIWSCRRGCLSVMIRLWDWHLLFTFNRCSESSADWLALCDVQDIGEVAITQATCPLNDSCELCYVSFMFPSTQQEHYSIYLVQTCAAAARAAAGGINTAKRFISWWM